MAAYASLLSLMHSIDQIQSHPKPPISLDKTYAQSLTEKLSFLRDFLEKNYGDLHVASQDFEGLETRMVAAAHEAEDIIESHIVDQLQPPNHEENNICFIGLYEGLEKVMQDLDLITVDLGEIMKNQGIKPERSYSMPVGQPGPPLPPHSITVGLDEALSAAIDKLTGQQSGHIIPIVGMGGIGKTTLARTLYEHKTIKEHFDLLGWATISQQYDSKRILVEVLACLQKGDSKQSMSQLEEHELVEMLHKILYGRRYLIVMDDIWSIQAWDKVNSFFRYKDSGSRIVITTRLSNLALKLSGGDSGIEMGFLDEDKSWDLLRKCLFGEQDCPMELNEIGKQIARNCKGLPLSIVVIGGLLAKSDQTKKHWQSIKENLNSLVNLSDNEHGLRILRMSYNHLPVHLKSCFLYMGIFPEDHPVRASTLVKLWVAEGVLKPISNQTMEATAGEYLKDLVHRNLILVDELKHDGNIKYCRIHDLLRDLCIKEAEDRFFSVAAIDRPNTKQHWHTQRRIGIHGRESSSTEHASRAIRNDLRSAALARSLVLDIHNVVSSRNFFRLLRVFDRIDSLLPEYNYPLKHIFCPVNLRHIVFRAMFPKCRQFPFSIYHLWNLQTLVVHIHNPLFCPTQPMIDIWRMPRLRHVKVDYFSIPDPHDDSSILPDLQTLQTVSTSKWCNETIKRIPNIKKLRIVIPYNESSSIDDYELANLGRHRELETLFCNFRCTDYFILFPGYGLARSLAFPNSLRKLRLGRTYILWEDLATKVGHLPHLQELDLESDTCKGTKWKTVGGQFPSLKVLKIQYSDLEEWIMEDCTHFPVLEHLVLDAMRNLKAIPPVIGELTTMKSIELIHCKESAAISAKKIEEVQEEYGNEDFRVSIVLSEKNQMVESLAGPKFQIRMRDIMNELMIKYKH